MGGGAARADVQVRVSASDPPSPAELGRWERFYVRIGYKTDERVVLSAQPYYKGRPVSAPTGGSPRVGPGEGEGVFWFAVVEPAQVDAVVVTAQTERGKVLAESRIAVNLTWTGAPRTAARQRAPWVEQQLAAEKRAEATRRSGPPNEEPAWFDGIALAFMATGLLYPVLQPLLLWRMRGGWRIAAALPLLLMLPIIAFTVRAYLDDSNLFPLMLILISPFAVFYLLAVMLLRRLAVQLA
jgi:hypothetical protein